jgi:Lsr2
MRKVQVQLEDDLTGGAADETIEFGLDGRTYELDLNAKHAATFRRQLAPFVEHARPAHHQHGHTRTRTAASRERSRQIRAWAEDEGLPVSAHGRLPGNVIQQYQRSHHSEQTGERSRASSRRGSS